MTNILEDLEITKVALCGRGMNQEAEILLFKSADVSATERPDEKEPTVADLTKEEIAATVAERDAFKAELDALTAMDNETLAALRGMDLVKADQQEDVFKMEDLPEPVRAALAKAEETEQRLAKMEADNRRAQFIAKAADFEHIGGAAELGPVLEEIDRLAPEAAKALETYMKSAEARIAESGLFAEFGATGDMPADPASQVEALVAKHVEAGMARPEAISKVLSENPDLYVPSTSK